MSLDHLFKAQFTTGQTIKIVTPRNAMLDACEVNIGKLTGKSRSLPAILCDGVDESDPWHVVNVINSKNMLLDHIAIKGAVSLGQAERLCQKYMPQMQGGHIRNIVTMTDNGMKTFIDSATLPNNTPFVLESDAILLDSMSTTTAVQWDEDNKLLSHGGRMSGVMYDMACCDTQGDLVEKMTPRDIASLLIDENCIFGGMLDAMMIKNRQFDSTMQKIAEALKTYDHDDLFVKSVTPIEPFKRNGVVNVGAIFTMSDTQTITVLFNNPDTTPAKLTPNDVLTSWKWMLNKRDVTATLQPRAVESKKFPMIAGRIIKLLARNHDRFKRAQMLREKDMLLLNELIDQVESSQSQIRSYDAQILQVQSDIDAETVRKQNQTEIGKADNEQNVQMNNEGEETVITGDEFGDFNLPEDTKHLRESVKTVLSEMIGKSFACPALNADVFIRKSGIKKVLSNSADARKLQAVTALKELLANATKVERLESYAQEKESNIKAYHVLSAPLVIDEAPLTVRFIVREDDKGHYHYDHTIDKRLVKNTESPLLDGLTATVFPMTGAMIDPEDQKGLTRIANCQRDNSIESNQISVNGMLDDATDSGMVLNMFIVENEQNVQMNNNEKSNYSFDGGTVKITKKDDVYSAFLSSGSVGGEFDGDIKAIQAWLAVRLQKIGEAMEGQDLSWDRTAEQLSLVSGEDVLGLQNEFVSYAEIEAVKTKVDLAKLIVKKLEKMEGWTHNGSTAVRDFVLDENNFIRYKFNVDLLAEGKEFRIDEVIMAGELDTLTKQAIVTYGYFTPTRENVKSAVETLYNIVEDHIAKIQEQLDQSVLDVQAMKQHWGNEQSVQMNNDQVPEPKKGVVFKKEAENIYRSIDYSVLDYQGHTSDEFQRANVKGRLEPLITEAEALLTRRFRDEYQRKQVEQSIENAKKQIVRWEAKQVAPEPEAMPEVVISENEQFLNDIIGGTADMSDEGFSDKLLAIAENLDPLLEELFEQASDAYADYAISLEV